MELLHHYISAKLTILLVLLTFNGIQQTSGAAPSGCALNEVISLIGRFDCDFNSITFPLTMTDFSSPDPQRLRIFNVSGTFPSPSFSGFNTFNTGTIDTDYPASLEIECVNGGTLDINAGTFTGMSYLQEFYITNCVISDLPDNVFSDFGTLNYFKIEGGSIGATQPNSLNGLSVARSSTPNVYGEFAIVDSIITTGELATGFLNPLTTVSTILLQNTALNTIDVNTFSQNTIVRNLSIAGNNFQTIPENIFSGLDTLMYLDMSNIPFNCSCSEVWFLDYLAEEDVNIVGVAVCEQPSNYASQRATKFHDQNCPYNPCGNIPGINADPLCYTIFQLFSYVVICGSQVMAWVAIYVYLNARVHMALPKYRLEQKKKKAWIKVKDSLYKGVVNLIPPSSTGMHGRRQPAFHNAYRKRTKSPNTVEPLDLPSYSDLVKEDLNPGSPSIGNKSDDKSYDITSDKNNQSKVSLQFSASYSNNETETVRMESDYIVHEDGNNGQDKDIPDDNKMAAEQ